MTSTVREKPSLNDWRHFGQTPSDSGRIPLHESFLLDGHEGRSLVDVETFLRQVEVRLGEKKRRGSVGYIELLTHPSDHALDAFVQEHNSDIIAVIDSALNGAGIFCWYAGRFIFLLDAASAMETRSILTAVNRGIVERVWNFQGAEVHATPVIGYSDLILTDNARELWAMVDTALDRAKTSLEVEPIRYGRRMSRADRVPARFHPVRLWQRTPQLVVLGFQFFLSLLLGLGAPFVLYAACDAFGSDISGPIYIGVVTVLVITATTIWIEGFLALKSTTPPLSLGAPYPKATIIIPAYLPNEAETIIETLHAFLRLEYPEQVQVIVAYNTPHAHMAVEDEMVELAATCAGGGRFLIEPIRVEASTSKAQNVNAVVGRVQGRFVGIFDADHHPHADSLRRAWRWLSNGWDIVQGRCSIRNGHDSWIARMVAIEFEQIYAVSHPGRARFHGFGIFGGSNGFWRTAVLHETRMRHSMLTEDIDSSIRAIVAGYKIAGDRDLISEELAPTAMKQLLNQRLRWAQGWFQVSFRRVMPALLSPRVSIRQKLGLLHLLVWRELFPWYSIQVVPIMVYWVIVYGWSYIHWTIPIFLATTIYTVSTGPGQIGLAYILAHQPMKKKVLWFFEYLLVSTFFFSPFKDALSRIAHVKEAMGERAWKVTPRAATPRRGALKTAGTLVCTAFLGYASLMPVPANAAQMQTRSMRNMIATLLGGEVATINAARNAARDGRNTEAATLYAKAIEAVPGRRAELLREYANALAYSGHSVQAIPLYREMLSSPRYEAQRWEIAAQLALAMTWAGQNASALAVYDRLLAHDPTNADAAVRRARMLASLGRANEALIALDRVPARRWASGPLAAVGAETLTDIAQSKANSGDAVAANQMIARAMQHGGRSVPVREAPESAVATRRGDVVSAAEPKTPREYHLAIAKAVPGSSNYWQMERGLAKALSASKQTAEALEAWTMYLRHAPADVDALLYRAAALADAQQHDRSLEAFRAIYAREPGNTTARAGVRDETIALARAAARVDHNADAQALFAAAIAVDSSRRTDLLREYADQLSFAGHAGDAVPIYIDWLGTTGHSAADRKQAMMGLGNAYSWSGDTKKAAATFAKLASAFPNDPLIRWTDLVSRARDAAHDDQNAEAAHLFAEAAMIAPERRSAIAREYADQLSFSGDASSAIPLYVHYLSAPNLSGPDRLAASKGLAQAYEWADRLPEAEAAYAQLAAQYPNIAEYRWNMLVVSARKDARADRNQEAATLFAQAIRLDPERSRAILREYADQLAFTQRSASAIGFYNVALTQPGLTDADHWAIKRSLALAFEWSGRLMAAKSAYEELISHYPAETSLQWHYLIVRARTAAKANNNREAADMLAKAIALVPARRLEILKEFADKLTYAGEAKRAIPLYTELLTQDHAPHVVQASAAGPDQTLAATRSIRLSLALALSWNKQQGAALREYRLLADADPDDVEAGIGMAKMLSWEGRQPEAIAIYEGLQHRYSDNGAVKRGLAEAEDWEGHHRDAQATLRDLLQSHPDDMEARRLLAQSLAWSGRPDKAIEEVHAALQLQGKPYEPDKAYPALRQGEALSLNKINDSLLQSRRDNDSVLAAR